MGLGPSIKMTTLHHFNCPVTRQLLSDSDIDFVSVFVDGVSEGCDEKISTATETAIMAEEWNLDGAIVAIDGWGNHHVDFVNVIEQLGIRNIPSVGLSYIGQQGRLVCTNEYVGPIVDFNKCTSGYESCVVGQNNPTQFDAFKAVALLKNKVKKSFYYQYHGSKGSSEADSNQSADLTREYIDIKDAIVCPDAEAISIKDGVLTVPKDYFADMLSNEPRIKDISMQIVRPGQYDFFVNSNLDYAPISCKKNGALGSGTTLQLDNIKLMLTGAEAESGFQPANIGSSEGILREQVTLDMDGTPSSTDLILHIDFLFENGEGRTPDGIETAHKLADQLLEDIRKDMQHQPVSNTETYSYKRNSGKMRIGLIKVVSGLGNMYDTSIFPNEPGGIIGAKSMRLLGNHPVSCHPLEIMDGAIHSLL